MTLSRSLASLFIASSVLTVGGLLQTASAQTYVPVYSPPVAAVTPATQFTDDQLDQLLAPIALYPDPLLAQILPASTYPLEIVQAQRWLQANPQPSEAGIDAQSWDPSIKALVHYPTVLQMMNDQLDWTQALGAAFTNQQQDVTESIQRLRAQAQAVGALTSNADQQVVDQDGAICILPAEAQLIYVPIYDPQVVYVMQPHGDHRPWITFGSGLKIGVWLNNDFDWAHHWVAAGADWRHDTDRRPVAGGRGNVRATPAPVTRAWSHDASKPAPVAPPAYKVHPGANEYRGYNAPVVAPRPTAQDQHENATPPQNRPKPAPQPAAQDHHENATPPQNRPEPTPQPAAQDHHENATPPQNRPEPAPRPAAPAPHEASPGVFGGYENRVDVQRSESRAQESRPAAPARAEPSPPPAAIPPATPQAPRDIQQPQAPTGGGDHGPPPARR